MKRLTTLLLGLLVVLACVPLGALAATSGDAPPGFALDPTSIVSAVLVYALTVAAKALGLPDATAPVRAFAALVALLIPLLLAWHAGTLASLDWNTAVPALWLAGQGLVNAVVVYLASAGLNAHVKDVVKQ